MHTYEYAEMEFSKDGGLDELLALDRYSITEYDGYEVGDTVVAIVDERGSKKVGEVTEILPEDEFEITARDGSVHTVTKNLLQKPLETRPEQFWDRWAKGGASIEETEEKREWFENELRWLFDGYKYSMGGRIQLMLGQEFVTGERANLTAYNCFSGDTIIHTKDGAFPIAELEGETVQALSFDGEYRNADIKSFGEQELYEVMLSNGEKIKATAGHEWIISNDGGGYRYDKKRVKTTDLEGNRIYVESSKPVQRNTEEVEEGIRHGMTYGDGTISKNRNGSKKAQLLLFGKKEEFSKYFEEYHKSKHHEGDYLAIYGLPTEFKSLPSNNMSGDYWYGFIVGLIATDGHVDSRGHVMLHSSNLDDLEAITKNMFKTGFGFSGIKMSRKLSPFDGSYSPVYKLSIIKSTVEEKDIIHPDHNNNFRKSPQKNKNRSTVKVEKVTPLGVKEEVFCGIEGETNTLVVGTGYLTGNCFVSKSPRRSKDPLQQFLNVIESAYYEASIMRRGGGVGLNISDIETVEGTGRGKEDFVIYIDEEHPDSEELQDRILLGKFDNVNVSTSRVNGSKNRYKIVVEDSVDEIFEALEEFVRVAYNPEVETIILDFNKLRERDAIVKGVNGRSSGAVSWSELFVMVAELLQLDVIDAVDFAEIFSHITNLIIQGGSRRGALMLVNEVESPTVDKFIERKRNPGFLEGANISVGVSDDFMDKVFEAKSENTVNDEAYEAEKVWDNLIESAWASAEPGIVWLERYNKESNSYYYNEIVATNPCGEQGLPEWGVCNLGHFVLPRYYDNDTGDVKWDDLSRAIKIAVRLQDNIIDYTDYFLEENEEVQKSERRVGIGTMGLGTLLVKMGLRYGSEEGLEFIDKLYKFIAKNAYEASIELAGEKGAFPEYDYEQFKESGFMKRLLAEFPELDEKLKENGIRNVTLLTQAPTGSTATLLENLPTMRDEFGGVSTGIEPYFSWSYWRASRLGSSEQIVPLAKDYMDEHGIEDVEDLPEQFVTAMELTPKEHVAVQAVIQKWTDSSISKTANVPSEFTVEQTSELYMKGYEWGLKGITIYRDGSRDSQVLATDEKDAKLEGHVEAEKLAKLKAEKESDKSQKEVELTSKQKEALEKFHEAVENINPEKVNRVEEDKTFNGLPKVEKLPARLFGMREKVKYQSGDKISKAYIHVYTDEEGTPVELWIEPTNMADKDMADALGRMTTQFLRYGITEDNVVQAIKHLQAGKSIMSLPNIVGRVLGNVYYGKIEMPSFGKKEEKKEKKQLKLQECSECGEEAYDVPNCICYACGFSSCN